MNKQLEKAIQHIKTRADAWAVKEVTEALQSISERLDKALSQEPCDDAVSRKAVFNAIEREDKWLLAAKGHNELTEMAFSGLKARIDALLPVTQKSGKWIEHPEIETSTPEYLMFYECSECGNKQCFCKSDIHKKRFCSNCGCRMVEPQESEEISERNMKMWEAIFKAESGDKE